MAKVCLTTYIYGVKYQDYIPLLVYSCNKAYPDYDIVLFLHEDLNPSVKRQLDSIEARNLSIKERHFADCPSMTPLKAKALRWVLWDDVFSNYDYLYIVDIDMIYIKEPLMLHEQHVLHMQTTGLPYDNLARHFYRPKLSMQTLMQRFKHAKFLGMWEFLFGAKDDYRLSGLHFIEIASYFKVFNSDMRETYKRKIYNGTFLKMAMSSNNETFLYSLMKEIGLTPDKVAIQTESTVMLDFNNPKRPEFRPHHGIHLGIFRQKWEPGTKTILESNTYSYYMKRFKEEILIDPVFENLYNTSSQSLKQQLDWFLYYYGLSVKS